MVRSPYGGRIRQVQWLGQNPDDSLNVEPTLLVHNGVVSSGENSTETSCLESSIDCLAPAPSGAIAHNPEIQSIDERPELGDDHIHYIRYQR